ncbi:hypothetical protein GBA52_009644 [Prunus armeniaca]|nr:hypothetical protein GBA52_009644 [Prunus armeniaca]
MDGKERASGKKMTIVIGPWGGNGGADWDDGIYNGIKLQYPDEYLVGASGHYCPMMFGIGPRLIRSLKFQSNRRTFGPYGIEEGTPFTFTVDGGKIVGLKGRSGWYLDAIGFHVSLPQPKNCFRVFRRVLEGLVARFQNLRLLKVESI